VVALTLAALACGGAAVESGAEPPSEAEPTALLPSVGATSIPVTVQPVMPERRYLTLEYPPRIRAGDSDVVRLTLEVDDLGNIVPTAEIEGNIVSGEVIEFPNLYETHNVIAEARFDIAGAEVRPSELISAPISEGQSAVFYWSIRPQEVGVYRGTIWLYLRFVDKVSGEESRTTVSAQIVEVEAVNFLGLSSNLARATGMIGSMIGVVLSFPFFSDLAKLLLKRFGRKA
jgi:hypothetical protein